MITGPLQGIQDSGHHQSAFQAVQDKAIKGIQEVKNLIPGLEDLRFLSQGLPNDVLVKRLQELQEKFVGGERKNDQKLKEKERLGKTMLCHKEKNLPRQSRRWKMMA